MQCSQCQENAVTYLRYNGRHLCKAHFLRFFEKRAKMELAKQGRLPEGTIAVALSGGKDSVALLDFLHRVTEGHPKIDLVALTVDEGIAGYRDGSMEICQQVTEARGIPWHVIKTEDMAGYTIDQYGAGQAGPEPGALGDADGPPGTERPACGPCGVFRRLGINRLAQDVGADAVATGHNLDDQAQTILMNVLKADVDRLARLAPHDQAVPGLVPRMLPFRSIPEKEVLLYALLRGLPIHDDEECPYAARSQRFALRDTLLELEARSPGTRHSLVRFQERLKPALAQAEQPPLQQCPTCGEPTSSASCKACAWMAPGHVPAR